MKGVRQRFFQAADDVLERVVQQGAEDGELLRDADPTTDHGENGEQHERPGHQVVHAQAGFVELGGQAGVCGRFAARLTEEGQADLTARVEGGQQGRERQRPEDQGVQFKGIGQDLILAPEAGGDDGETAQGQAADQESPADAWDAFPQAAHVEHVLRVEGWAVRVRVVAVVIGRVAVVRRRVTVMPAVRLVNVMLTVFNRVNHGAGAEEEESLEEGMRQQVKSRRDIRANAQRGKHVAELADG